MRTPLTALDAWAESTGTSFAQLARDLGVHPTMISQIRKGLARPSTRLLAKLCRRTGLSADVLLAQMHPEKSKRAR